MESKDSKNTLLMGHRGTGSCDQQTIERNKRIKENLHVPAQITENTLRAMRAAHEAGMQYVEFDVQLSKDGHAVVHHDFYTSDGHYVGDLTLEELKNLNKSISDHQEHRYPTLKDFFSELPQDLGFDIEIKYPRTYLDGKSFCPGFKWDMEEYISKIVCEVKQYTAGANCSRPLFYSCFVSDVCRLLHKLHPEYPTVYIVGSSNAKELTEVNGHSVEAGFAFANSIGLYGLAVNAGQLLTDQNFGKEFVQKCKVNNLRCFSWGLDNNNRDNRILQRDWGIDGVIFDNIHFGLPHL